MARNDPEDPDHAEAVEYLDDYAPNVIEKLPMKSALGPLANDLLADAELPGNHRGFYTGFERCPNGIDASFWQWRRSIGSGLRLSLGARLISWAACSGSGS